MQQISRIFSNVCEGFSNLFPKEDPTIRNLALSALAGVGSAFGLIALGAPVPYAIGFGACLFQGTALFSLLLFN